MSIMFKCREAETFGNSSYFVDFFCLPFGSIKKSVNPTQGCHSMRTVKVKSKTNFEGEKTKTVCIVTIVTANATLEAKC